MLRHDRVTLQDTQPDLVIVDGRISTILAAESLRIPVVSIVRDSYTPGHQFEAVDDEFWSSMLAATQNAAQQVGVVEPSSDVREVFVRHAAICPSIPELEEAPPGVLKYPVHYSGLIAWRHEVGLGDHELVRPADILIYGALRTADDVDEVVRAFAGTGKRLYVVMPNRAVLDRIGTHEPNRITTSPYLDLEQHAETFEGAIAHGGHGICLTLMNAGVPTVFAPPRDRPEQYFNSARMQQNGFGELVDTDASNGWASVPGLLYKQSRRARLTTASSRSHDAVAFAVRTVSEPKR